MGLEQAGFCCKGHCEIDKFANLSYFAMHKVKKDEWFSEDITKVKAADLPDCSLWTAGFPCQDVSVAGRRAGLNSKRSGLFFEIIRLLKEKEEHKPRWVLLENVKGLFSANGSRDFGTILYQLAALGYGIEYALLNSKNFGVPQNRERVYIVCDLTGRSTGKIFPLEYQSTGALKKICGRGQGERIYDVNGLAPTLASDSSTNARTGLFLVNILADKGIVYREVSNCMDANYYKGLGVNQRRTGVLCMPPKGDMQGTRIRRLTPQETFRLQGVPDDYFERARQVCSDTQLYRQAGNAVTVPVVYAIGKKIKEYLESEEQKGENG